MPPYTGPYVGKTLSYAPVTPTEPSMTVHQYPYQIVYLFPLNEEAPLHDSLKVLGVDFSCYYLYIVGIW